MSTILIPPCPLPLAASRRPAALLDELEGIRQATWQGSQRYAGRLAGSSWTCSSAWEVFRHGDTKQLHINRIVFVGANILDRQAELRSGAIGLAPNRALRDSASQARGPSALIRPVTCAATRSNFGDAEPFYLSGTRGETGGQRRGFRVRGELHGFAEPFTRNREGGDRPVDPNPGTIGIQSYRTSQGTWTIQTYIAMSPIPRE